MIDPNDEGAIPDDTLPDAPYNTASTPQATDDPQADFDYNQGRAGDLNSANPDGDDGTDVIQQLLDYGRQKNGLSGGGQGETQVAGNIPAVPAGPGGDKPQENPFGTRTPKIPFGKRYAEGGPVEDDDVITGAIPDAESVGANQLNQMADDAVSRVGNAIRGAIPDQIEPNAPDRASQVGGNLLNDMADGIAGDVGSALKSGAQAVGNAVRGAIPDQIEPNAPDRASQVGGNQLNGMADGIAGDVGSALKSGAQAVGNAVRGAIPDNVEPNAPDRASQVGGNQLNGMADDMVAQAGGGIKRLLNYLQGDAAPQPLVQHIEQSVDPQGQMSDSDRKLAAIKAATEKGGPDAGWSMLQANRQKYEALRHSAAAVLDGSQQRPGDPAQAAQLATQAYGHLPDGSDIHFAVSQTGFTATVTQGDKVLAKVPMSKDQFRSYLLSPQQQFDNAMETGPTVALQQAAKQGGLAGGGPDAGGGMQQAVKQLGGQPGGGRFYHPGVFSNPDQNGVTRMPKPDGSYQTETRTPVSGGQGGEDGEHGPAIRSLEDAQRVAARLFPMIGAGQAQREKFVADYMAKGGQEYPTKISEAQAKQKNALDVAGVRANASRDNAGTRAEAVRYTADQRRDSSSERVGAYDRRTGAIVDENVQKLAATARNAHERNEMITAGKILSNPMAEDKDRALAMNVMKKYGVGEGQVMQGVEAPMPQAPQAQTPAPAAGAQQGGGSTRVINGHTYRKVEGGWQRVKE